MEVEAIASKTLSFLLEFKVFPLSYREILACILFFLEFLQAFPIKTYLKYLHFFLKIYVSQMAFLGLPHDFFERSAGSTNFSVFFK